MLAVYKGGCCSNGYFRKQKSLAAGLSASKQKSAARMRRIWMRQRIQMSVLPQYRWKRRRVDVVDGTRPVSGPKERQKSSGSVVDSGQG